MSNARRVVAMLNSRAAGDDEQFYLIALQIAASEARQGRKATAQALREAIESARGQKSRSDGNQDVPELKPELKGLVHQRSPKYTFEDVVLDDGLLECLRDLVCQQQERQRLKEHGKAPSRRALFVGPPGSGKTMTAEALAGQLKLPFSAIRLEGLITRFMGETAAKLRVVFDETMSRRGVYLFDEFDAIGGSRDAGNDVAEMRRVLNSFLQYIEEENPTDSLIIAATNHPQLLDSALPRRFDAVLAFEMPSERDIVHVIKKNLRPLAEDQVEWDRVAEFALGLSQAEVAMASESAVKSAILKHRTSVTTSHLMNFLTERHNIKKAFQTKREMA